EQRTSRGGRKSTVATLTEVYHYLRLLFVKLGTQYCPRCEIAIEPQTQDMILARIQADWKGRQIDVLAPMVVGRKGIYKELAAWAAARGFEQLRVDGEYLSSNPWPVIDRYREHDIEILVGSVTIGPRQGKALNELLTRALDLGNGLVIVADALQSKARGRKQEKLFSTQRACPSCGDSFDELDPRLFSYNSKHG